MQRSPADPNAAATSWSAAYSRSASGRMIAWFLAPPSAWTRLPCAVAVPWMYFAIGVEPDERHGGHVGVLQERVDRLLVAVDDVEDALGQSGLGPQLGQDQGGRRVPLAGLEHEGVAAGDGHREHPHRHHRREVERRDADADTQRLPERVQVDPRRDLCREVALEQLRDAAGELDDLQPALRPRPRASLSTLPCSSVIASAIRPTLAFTSSRKAKSTLVRWLRDDSDHVRVRLARRPYDGVHVVAGGQGDLGLLLPRRRVPDAAATGAVPARGLAADPVVDGPHRWSLSFVAGRRWLRCRDFWSS